MPWIQVAGTKQKLYPKWISGWLFGHGVFVGYSHIIFMSCLLTVQKLQKCWCRQSWTGKKQNKIKQTKKPFLLLSVLSFRSVVLGQNTWHAFSSFFSILWIPLRPHCPQKASEGLVVFAASECLAQKFYVCSSTLLAFEANTGLAWGPCGLPQAPYKHLPGTTSACSWLPWFFHSDNLSKKGHII